MSCCRSFRREGDAKILKYYLIFIAIFFKPLYYNIGLGESSLGHRRREEFPAIYFIIGAINLKELSIFIDESGDFGEIKERPAYYLVTLIFHDQRYDINEEISKLERSVKDSGFDVEYIHTGPVIRREGYFKEFSIDERRRLLYKMLNFYNHCDISHDTIIVNRQEAPEKVMLSGRLAKLIRNVIDRRSDYFYSFDKVIVYYDNGQSELSSILNAVFSLLFHDVEFRKAEPQKYRLLQVADFICSMELINIKRNENRLSNSEKTFFFKPQEFKKTFWKSIEKKRLR